MQEVRSPEIASEKKITILRINQIEHEKDVERDSIDAWWKCNILYLSFKSIRPQRKEATILIKSFSKEFIKTGKYLLISSNELLNLPSFEAAQ